MNSADASSNDSWDRGLRLAFSKRDASATSTWKQPDASATPLPEPGPAPTLKTSSEGSLLAEPYKVLGEVGRGGIGIVLQARDLALGREVAVKVLQPRHQANPAAVTRFTREAKIAAQLQHPGIVPVYAAGQDELDRPYIAMKLLRGSTLEELLDKRKDVKEGRAGYLRIFEQVCQTMAYAHSRGVIHRDLKPGNVMVGAFGEVQIIDWGFARVLGAPALEDSKTFSLLDQALSPQESSALSVAGVPIGTPAYMAPEQALGDLKALDERTDVFCLGSMLIEILSGKPPYASEDIRQVMDSAAKADLRPAFARLDQSGAEAELVALVKDCLRASKTARPKNAGEVAERVSAFLAATSERARQAELTAERERSRARDERRKKQFVAAAAAVVVLLVAGAGWLAWSGAKKRQKLEVEIGLVLGEAEKLGRDEDWAEAERRAVHATAMVKGADVGRDLRARVEEFVRQAAAKKEEHARMNAIYKLRMHSNSPPHEMDRRYYESFKAIGIDVDAQASAAIGAMIRAYDPAARKPLLLALDDWTMRFKPGGRRSGPPDGDDRRPPPRESGEPSEDGRSSERRRRILEAAIVADDVEWRNRLRTAMLAEDGPALLEMARTAEKEGTLPPPESLVMLSMAMARARRPDVGLQVLQTAFRLYPTDFWVSFLIAHENLPRLGNPDPQRLELCERHARLALVLNPSNPHAHALVASVLFVKARLDKALPGDAEEAMARLRAAARDDGPFGESAKLILRAHEGDAGAIAEVRRLRRDPDHPPLIRSLLETAPR